MPYLIDLSSTERIAVSLVTMWSCTSRKNFAKSESLRAPFSRARQQEPIEIVRDFDGVRSLSAFESRSLIWSRGLVEFWYCDCAIADPTQRRLLATALDTQQAGKRVLPMTELQVRFIFANHDGVGVTLSATTDTKVIDLKQQLLKRWPQGSTGTVTPSLTFPRNTALR